MLVSIVNELYELDSTIYEAKSNILEELEKITTSLSYEDNTDSLSSSSCPEYILENEPLRFSSHNILNDSKYTQNTLIYPSTQKVGWSELVIWDEGGYYWESEPFLFCATGVDCQDTGIVRVRDINNDYYNDFSIANWWTGLGGHWTDIYFVYNPESKGFDMVTFIWEADKLTETGYTFDEVLEKQEVEPYVTAYQSFVSSWGEITMNFSVSGFNIDQSVLEKEYSYDDDYYIQGHEISFVAKDPGSAEFVIRSVVRIMADGSRESL
ncbi:hypothetical protein JW962_02650 [Candidatus Dojkabacteria bacterium]|nr:hypothetical protein [Candidatus Dojkabacteria bacterium]